MKKVVLMIAMILVSGRALAGLEVSLTSRDFQTTTHDTSRVLELILAKGGLLGVVTENKLYWISAEQVRTDIGLSYEGVLNLINQYKSSKTETLELGASVSPTPSSGGSQGIDIIFFKVHPKK